jgi:beta-aspartyl-peptidase (threonine type)
VAHDVACLMEYKNMTVEQATNEIVWNKLSVGQGGLIALDSQGNFALPFNTSGMFRGYIRADGIPHVALYKE